MIIGQLVHDWRDSMRYKSESRMQQIIDCVDKYYTEHGTTPSVRTIAEEIGFSIEHFGGRDYVARIDQSHLRTYSQRRNGTLCASGARRRHGRYARTFTRRFGYPLCGKHHPDRHLGCFSLPCSARHLPAPHPQTHLVFKIPMCCGVCCIVVPPRIPFEHSGFVELLQ